MQADFSSQPADVDLMQVPVLQVFFEARNLVIIFHWSGIHAKRRI